MDSNGKRARISRRRLVAKSSASAEPAPATPTFATPTFAIGQLPRLRPAVRARVAAPATGYCTRTVAGPAGSRPRRRTWRGPQRTDRLAARQCRREQPRCAGTAPRTASANRRTDGQAPAAPQHRSPDAVVLRLSRSTPRGDRQPGPGRAPGGGVRADVRPPVADRRAGTWLAAVREPVRRH